METSLHLNYVDMSVTPTEGLQAVQPLLEAAIAESIGEYTLADVVCDIISGKLQLWVLHDEKRPLGVFCLRVEQHPRTKVCFIQYAAGVPDIKWTTMREALKPWVAQIEQWAFDMGCDYCECACRPGMKKYALLFGYKETYRIYAKALRGKNALN